MQLTGLLTRLFPWLRRSGCAARMRAGLLLPILLSAHTARALDPSKAITQYHQDVWTERDGLPQGSVQAITQTRDGYLWIGTRDGLARFDGVTFTVFRAENSPGLRSNDIRALHEDQAGSLWIGTFNGGLSRYRDGEFVCHKEEGLPGKGVLDICEDQPGSLWLGTWDGLAHFQGGKFTAYTRADGLAGRTGWSVCANRQGRIWTATVRGLNCLEEGAFRSYTSRNGLINTIVRKVYIDHEGVLWVGSLGGLSRFHEEKFTHFTTRDGLADNKVRTILQDHDANLWIGTWKGLSRFQNGTITSFTRHDGLPHDLVEALYEDREGSLWIGTRGGGLARLKDGKFSVLTTKEGLANDVAKCIFESRDGTVWIGSDGGGLSRYRQGEFTNYSTKDGLLSNFVWALGEDREGNIWAGTGRPAGLSMFRNGKFKSFGQEQGLVIDHGVRAVFGDHEGNVWVGGDGGGLGRYREGIFTNFSTQDGLPSTLVRVIGQDSGGNLWIGTGGGLCRFRDGNFTTFTTTNGLAHNAVYCFYEDREETLWFGTQKGLSRYRGGQFTSYTTSEGLFQDLIYQLLEDSQHNLWMSCNRGVFSLSKMALQAFDQGKIPKLPCVTYGVADGMKTAQCEGGTQPAGWKTKNGNLLFPTVNGVVMLNPDQIKCNQQPPPVLIEQVVVGNRPLDPRQPAKLAPGSRELRFHYTALSFLAPDKVRFRYKLEGLDKEWVAAETRRVAFYHEIPPGDYRFRVMACNNDGIWNETGAMFAFVLPPYFFQTAWFYLLCVAALGLAAWSFHRHRMKQAQAQFSLVLAERTRIARDLHDTLAQGFAGIAFQLEAVATKLSEAPAQAHQHLNLALQMVRHSLTEARRSVMNLRSSALETGDLPFALSETARQMMADRTVEVELKTSGSVRPLPAKIEDNLLRVGQEALTNSFKYSEAAKISIELDYHPNKVVLRIHDDGKGFDIPALTTANGAHFGLLGMRERAKQMGATLDLKSSPGAGTQVIVEAPIPGFSPQK